MKKIIIFIVSGIIILVLALSVFLNFNKSESNDKKLEKVTLACESTNIASIKTIESLGGILNYSEIDPSDGILTNIYIINVKETINKYKNI